jgi:hypothetical protein
VRLAAHIHHADAAGLVDVAEAPVSRHFRPRV